VQEEYDVLFETMDKNNDFYLGPQEVKIWVDRNMDSICAKYRPDMVAKIEKAERDAELDTKALVEAFEVLNADDETPGTDADAAEFLAFIDMDDDSQVTGAELWEQIK